MKKKLIAGILLATLAIGTLNPISSEAAAKKTTTTATKTKEQTKIDGVAIKDLIAGKYNDISIIKSTTETKDVVYHGKKVFQTHHRVRQSDFTYKTDKLYTPNVWLTNTIAYGKDYKNKTIDYGDGYTETFLDEDISLDENQRFITPKVLEYSSDNLSPAIDDNGDDCFYEVPTLSRNEEIARWRLDPSCFKTTKTKLTDNEIIIQGTYTFAVKKLKDGIHSYVYGLSSGDYRFDAEFFDEEWGYDAALKDVKCDATVIFYRDTKQLKSLDLKAKLPKDGYKWTSWCPDVRTVYNASYTFEHQLTEAQKAERGSKMTEEEMIEGKANEFETIDYEYKSNYNFMGPDYDYNYTRTISDDDIRGKYIRGPYYKGYELHSTGFVSSRFKITSSETNKNTTTITGVYKLNTDSKTLYDLYAEYALSLNNIYGNFNDITADVTIVFDANTKSMKKATLQYNFDNVTLTDEVGKVIAPGSAVCSHIYTFNNN